MSGNMKVHFKTKNGKKRNHGYTLGEVPGYKQSVETVESTEDTLASVFETAKSNGETLDGSDETVDAAIDDPLSFVDFLILVDGTIEFDPDHVRETDAQT